MSDYLTRCFRAQVTTAFNSIMRATVHEVTQIFENSFKDYKVELSQKGEEIIRLRVKLQEAEMKLRATGDGGDDDVSAEKKDSHSQDVQSPYRPIPEHYKMESEEPDDWCAPLGSESLAKEEHAVCPSVPLRPLTIPLWHIPIKAHGNDDRSSQLPSYGQKNAVKQEIADVPVTLGRRLRGGNVLVSEKGKRSKRRARDIDPEAKPETEKETVTSDVKGMFPCKSCPRVFDKEFGLHVHARSHRKCTSCRKVCSTPSALRYHQRSCKRFQTTLAKYSTRLPQQIPETHEEPNQSQPSEKLNITKKSSPSSNKHEALPVPEDTSDNTMYVCNLCPREFQAKTALKQHKAKMHKAQMRCLDSIGELSWTRPLEGLEEIQENSDFPSKDVNQAVNQDDSQDSSKRAGKRDRKPQEMGTRCSKGFMCSVCKRVVKTEFLLTRHFRVHEREKPCTGLVSGNGSTPDKVPCQHCGVVLRSHNSHKQHVLRFHKIWPHTCNLCGEGFSTAERLQSHNQRLHANANIEVTV
ncbi:uncharacterized protein LOC143007945 [Genypterus blacodes]|uniref:uncharacterized protein LOC143007945 n=1 Tax=Genypterus blacodes TaxID=154954 RepID=UPI003F75ACD8